MCLCVCKCWLWRIRECFLKEVDLTLALKAGHSLQGRRVRLFRVGGHCGVGSRGLWRYGGHSLWALDFRFLQAAGAQRCLSNREGLPPAPPTSHCPWPTLLPRGHLHDSLVMQALYSRTSGPGARGQLPAALVPITAPGRRAGGASSCLPREARAQPRRQNSSRPGDKCQPSEAPAPGGAGTTGAFEACAWRHVHGGVCMEACAWRCVCAHGCICTSAFICTSAPQCVHRILECTCVMCTQAHVRATPSGSGVCVSVCITECMEGRRARGHMGPETLGCREASPSLWVACSPPRPPPITQN